MDAGHLIGGRDGDVDNVVPAPSRLKTREKEEKPRHRSPLLSVHLGEPL